MGYVVLTTKHHSGYAMWPTRCSDFSISNSPYGKDIVGGFVDAVRAEGSLVRGSTSRFSDWHHPDYPPFTEAGQALCGWVLSLPRPTPEAWARYLGSMRAELTELLTDYGRIDLLWFDGGWERPDWGAAELEEMIRVSSPTS